MQTWSPNSRSISSELTLPFLPSVACDFMKASKSGSGFTWLFFSLSLSVPSIAVSKRLLYWSEGGRGWLISELLLLLRQTIAEAVHVYSHMNTVYDIAKSIPDWAVGPHLLGQKDVHPKCWCQILPFVVLSVCGDWCNHHSKIKQQMYSTQSRWWAFQIWVKHIWNLPGWCKSTGWHMFKFKFDQSIACDD